MAGPPLNPIYYPFSVVPATSNQNVFPYDIVIDEVFPGIIFDAQEAGGTYAVIREVNGCLWFVVNADYDETTLQWTQEDPTNPNTPAYAMEMCAAGTWQWLYGAPTLVAGSPVTWVSYLEINSGGSVVSANMVYTATGNPVQQIFPTWNAGSSAIMTARSLNVFDISSSVNSILDNLAVNGTTVWSVNKAGVLTTGIVPYARVTGGPAPFPGFNNVTFTGTSTFSGPAIFNDGLTVNNLPGNFNAGMSVVGGETVDTLDVTGTATVGTLDVTGAATVTGSLTADSTLYVAANSNLAGGATVTGGESVTGGLTTDTLGVTGTTTLHGDTSIDPGHTITIGGTTPVVTLESTDSTISVSQVSPTEYNIMVAGGHVAVGGSIQKAAATTAGSTGGGNGPGTLSLTIPGTGIMTYDVTVECTVGIGGAGSFTLTDNGGSFSGAPVTWSVGNFASYVHMYDYGTATGGTTITSTASSGYSEFYRITAIRVT